MNDCPTYLYFPTLSQDKAIYSSFKTSNCLFFRSEGSVCVLGGVSNGKEIIELSLIHFFLTSIYTPLLQ